MTIPTTAEMVAAGHTAIRDGVLDAWPTTVTVTPPGGSGRSITIKSRPTMRFERRDRMGSGVESIAAFVSREDADQIETKTTFTLEDGRVFTFHDNIIFENETWRVIEVTRNVVKQIGRR